MAITHDPVKCARTLAERGLHFADAELVFSGITLKVEDTRKDYGGKRIVCYGLLEGRVARIATSSV